MFKPAIAIIISICISLFSFAQEDCNGPFVKVLGSIIENESGYNIAISKKENVLYVGGLKNDSAVIIRMQAGGEIDWTRTFKIVEGHPNRINGMFVDADGMIGVAGTAGTETAGGNVFIFRYNPNTNSLLWSFELESTSASFCSGMIEMGVGGNYLLANNPTVPNDAELIEFDKGTGDIVSQFSKHYDLGSSETIFDLVFHNGALYGAARFTDGGGLSKMRNTLLKINPDDGSIDWITLGHRPQSATARLYTSDLVIDQEQIYSVITGDADGTSIDVTEIFVQKTNLQGDVAWIKKYDLPGTNDWLDEIIYSDNGFIIMARNRSAPSDIELFKIDRSGNVLWAKKFDYTANDNSILLGAVMSQIVEFDSHIYFTAISESNGQNDMILVRTDLQGEINDTCSISSPINVIVSDVINAVFYSVEPNVFSYTPDITTKGINVGSSSSIRSRNLCINTASIITQTDTNICIGDNYEGYTSTGTYVDNYMSINGCDSIRTLHLVVKSCTSDPCEGVIGAIYGIPEGDARGYSLAATPDNDGFYLAGLRKDSVLMLKVSLTGEVIWARTLDIVPGEKDDIAALVLDSEGMIAVSGTKGNPVDNGSVYVFRYNPNTNQVLWSKTYSHSPSNYNFSLMQKGPGGNYIASDNFFDGPNSNNDTELLEIDKNTGDIVPAFTKRYDLGSSEGLATLILYQNFLYGIGRYTDGPATSDMRNTIVKLNPADGSQIWTKMGHLPGNVAARLYGFDMVIDQDFIYSGHFGDPTGSSTTNTKLYLQKTNLDGNIIWVKQYDLPGTNDVAYEIIKSGDGFVILAGNRDGPGSVLLFKIDPNGNVLWARLYQLPSFIDQIGNLDSRSSQLIEVGGKLVFTAYATNTSSGTNLILIRTDLEGIVDIPCVNTTTISIPVTSITNAVFYAVNPSASSHQPEVKNFTTQAIPVEFLPRMECLTHMNTLSQLIEATICEGESYEKYTEAGTYIDTFTTQNGCDSVRTLNLTVIPDIHTTISKNICEGDSFEGFIKSGIYVDTFTTAIGCDSIRKLILQVNERSISNNNRTICEGDSYQGHTSAGFYSDTLVSVFGCDSILNLTLATADFLISDENAFICYGQSLYGYSQSGMFVDTFISFFGCDSVRRLNLEIASSISLDFEVSVCEGLKYGYHNPGTYVDTFFTLNGCDSIRTIHVTNDHEYIPNIFSPNGDGINDFFEIITSPDPDKNFEYFAIFDRFGNMAYEVSEDHIHWDGKDSSGRNYNPAVFTFILISNCAESQIVEHGDITLIR